MIDHPVRLAATLGASLLVNWYAQTGGGTMPLDINAILVQIPLVGLVIWIITARDKMWQEFLRTERQFWAEMNAQNTASVNAMMTRIEVLSEAFGHHDQRVSSTMETMAKFAGITFANAEIEEEKKSKGSGGGK